MADLFYTGAYWGPRTESLAQCATRLEICLRSLGASHEVLSRWYGKGRSRSAASRRAIDVEIGTLESMLARGRNRTDVGGEVIAELGFSLELWNNNPVAVSFSTLCGAAPTTPSIMNSCVLTLPAASGPATDSTTPRSPTGSSCPWSRRGNRIGELSPATRRVHGKMAWCRVRSSVGRRSSQQACHRRRPAFRPRRCSVGSSSQPALTRCVWTIHSFQMRSITSKPRESHSKPWVVVLKISSLVTVRNTSGKSVMI